MKNRTEQNEGFCKRRLRKQSTQTDIDVKRRKLKTNLLLTLLFCISCVAYGLPQYDSQLFFESRIRKPIRKDFYKFNPQGSEIVGKSLYKTFILETYLHVISYKFRSVKTIRYEYQRFLKFNL